MKIAVISDIHGNLEAMNRVLEDIKKIRLYYTENEYKEFWTCGNEFTIYYL